MSELFQREFQRCFSSDKVLSFFGFAGEESSLAFSEFGSQVESMALALKKYGVNSGVVVAVLAPSSLSLARACAAVWHCGATLCVLPTPTRLGNLEHYLQETVGKLQESCASLLLTNGESGGVFADFAQIPILNIEDWGAWSEDVGPLHENECPAALVQFSSGTTRKPKAILLSAEALIANSRAVLGLFPGGASQHSLVSWLPFYHDMGLIGCFLMPLLAPGDLTIMGPEVFAVSPLTWLKAISEKRATTSSAPNFALNHCVARITEEEMAGLDLSSWSIAMVGAETVRPDTLRRFAEHFAPAGFSAQAFSPVYGLAEATLAVSFSPLGQGLKTLSYDEGVLAESGQVRPGKRASASLGTAIPGVEIEIRQDGQVLPPGTLGELWVRSPSLYSGTLQEGRFIPREDEWINTQDSAFLYQDELYLYGRRSDILLLDGRNHDPGLLEESAEQLSELRRCCALVLPQDDRERDRLTLLCELRKSWEGDLSSLEDSLRSHLADQGRLRPERVHFLPVNSLPTTTSGKLQRGKAAALLQAGVLPLRES